MSAPTARRNRATGLVLFGLAAGMVGLSFAAVPLYRLFCQVTGYGGTTQTADAAPGVVGDRVIKVRFNADVSGDLPWRFAPVEREVTVRVGEERLIFYRAENRGDEPVIGTATFNVTPLKAGPYFAKVACFCFEEQRLAAGQSVEMPVSFFIDPEIMTDAALDEVRTITLSYAFYRDEAAETRDTPDDKSAQATVPVTAALAAGPTTSTLGDEVTEP